MTDTGAAAPGIRYWESPNGVTHLIHTSNNWCATCGYRGHPHPVETARLHQWAVQRLADDLEREGAKDGIYAELEDADGPIVVRKQDVESEHLHVYVTYGDQWSIRLERRDNRDAVVAAVTFENWPFPVVVETALSIARILFGDLPVPTTGTNLV
jgi:hypothetical protein